MARDITKQEWAKVGLDESDFPNDAASSSLELTAERITSLLVIRLVALTAPSHKFDNLSTSCICQTLLRSRNIRASWPESISEAVVRQTRSYVRTILQGYRENPYHNYEHAYHVFVSANKMMDLILQSRTMLGTQNVSAGKLRFEDDPLMHMALLFAALIHDVEHQGVPNQQLILENDPLALQYNDQSVAEQRSLAIGFIELRKSQYNEMRDAMFLSTFSGDGYRRFRDAVTYLVLATDISSRERSEIVKRKWQNAFAERLVKESGGIKPSCMTSSRTPVLQPPTREQSNSSNRHKQFKEKMEQKKQVERKESLNSWMDFNTPSKHFPRNAGASMNDSTLSFWWFCPSSDDSSDDEEIDECDLDDRTSLYVSCLLREEDAVDSASQSLDFEASFSLFSRDGQESTTTMETEPSFNYPHNSQLFHRSSTRMLMEDNESQHLLSPAKISRLDRVVRRHSTTTTCVNDARSPRTPLSTSRYCDLDKVSPDFGNEELQANSKEKPRHGRFSLRAFCSPSSPPHKLKPTKASNEPNKTKGVMTEFQSMLARLRTVDLMSSIATMDETATSSVDGSSMSLCMSSSNIKFDPQSDMDETLPSSSSSRELHSYQTVKKRRGALDSTLHDLDEGDEEEATSSSEMDGENTVVPSQEVENDIITMSLLEHILLVSDVAHTVQNFELMVKFAHRLSCEMDRAIANGRGCGICITDGSIGANDALMAEWYNNQISFLQGYVMPLAGRLEQTGFLPSVETTGNVSEGRNGRSTQPVLFLSRAALENVRLWECRGMDVLKSWQRHRDFDDNVRHKTTKAVDGKPWLSKTNKMLHRKVSTSHADCIPSRS